MSEDELTHYNEYVLVRPSRFSRQLDEILLAISCSPGTHLGQVRCSATHHHFDANIAGEISCSSLAARSLIATLACRRMAQTSSGACQIGP
jgi:hypothetical protein